MIRRILAPAVLSLILLPAAEGRRFDSPGGFGPAIPWASALAFSPSVPLSGDFNGDGLSDVAVVSRSGDASDGDVLVALNAGGARFGTPALWLARFSTGDAVPVVGDFDGDGLDDIANFTLGGAGQARVARSTGTAFAAPVAWFTGGILLPGEVPLAGDFNGDGRDDMAVCTRGSVADVFVGLSTGTRFAAVQVWQDDFAAGAAVPRAGDVNGDGRADLVCFVRDSRTGVTGGDVEVALSDGSRFAYAPVRFWHQNFAPTTAFTPLLADLNGDGSDDILAVHDDGRVFAAIKTAVNAFASGDGTQTADPFWLWHPRLRGTAGSVTVTGRFNRDLNADLASFALGGVLPAFGEASVALAGGHAQPEPDSRLSAFGHGTLGPGAGPVVKPLLVVLSECAGAPLTRTPDEYAQGVFGPGHPNIRSFFLEMSNGAFTFSRAGVAKVGPYDCPLPDATSVRDQLEDAADADGPGGFEFKTYDTDGDGTVENDELALLGISTFDRAGGQTFGVDATLFAGTPRQVRVALRWCFAGDATSLDNMAHELAHGSCGIADLYGSNCRGLGLTLASCTAGASTPTRLVHLDPWHKIRLGWTRPLIYDIRHFPAGATVRPPQSGTARPIILYDSARGTEEFFVLEHRNGNYTAGTVTWTAAGGTWRANPRTAFPAAGYDVDVQDTGGRRSGFLAWSVKTDAAHNVLDIRQRIGAGPNGLLNSPRLGDDLLWPETGTPSQIHAGPDGVLSSVIGGDDNYWQDALCLPQPNPADMIARETSTLTASGPAATTLRFYDSTDTGVQVRGDEVNGNAGQFVEWGRAFRPFIEAAVAPVPARPGQTLSLVGSLGQRGRFQPRLISADGRLLLTPRVLTWTGATATLEIPSGPHQGGSFRFLLFDDASLRTSSNAMAVTLMDPYEAWRQETFSPAQLADPEVSGDDADPDGDGLSNFAEYAHGLRALGADESPVRWDFSGGFVTATFRVRGDRGALRLVLQTSSDLRGWAVADSVALEGAGPFGELVSGFLRVPRSGAGPAFARLRIERP